MDISDIISIILRIIALVLVAVFVIYMMLMLKKVRKTQNKILNICLILFAVGFVLFITLLPYYLIIPNKIDLSSFESIVAFHEERNEDYYYFDTKNYGGEIYVADIEHLGKYKRGIKRFVKDQTVVFSNNESEFTNNEMLFHKEENGINILSAPVVARRSEWRLGYRDDVRSKMILWDDENVVCISYWYHSSDFFINAFTFPELFYKKTLDFEDIFESYVKIKD